jgi:hypothetical protein
MNIQSYRDQEWLENMLADTWAKYFSDVDQANDVVIKFGRAAKQRLGSIGLDRKNPNVSVITINSIYKDLEVPEYVIRATIVHEMSHYAHGFNSPHDQKHRYPHSGGVIRQEFAERGLEDLYLQQKKWLKENWAGVVGKYLDLSPRRYKTVKLRSPWWMNDFF